MASFRPPVRCPYCGARPASAPGAPLRWACSPLAAGSPVALRAALVAGAVVSAAGSPAGWPGRPRAGSWWALNLAAPRLLVLGPPVRRGAGWSVPVAVPALRRGFGASGRLARWSGWLPLSRVRAVWAPGAGRPRPGWGGRRACSPPAAPAWLAVPVCPPGFPWLAL